MDIEEIKRLLNHIYTDMLMLKEGNWQPDEESCDYTIDTIEELAKEIGVELKDTRV